MLDFEDFKYIKQVHVDSIYSEENKWRCFKNISLLTVINDITLDGDWAEFGVYRGEFASMLEGFCASMPNRKLFLFDSFEGLPEDWNKTDFLKGAFALSSDDIPKFHPYVSKIQKGWFHDTLPCFVNQKPRPFAFIHIDCDLYSSTRTVLNECNSLIVPGTILLFDEFFLPGKDGISDDECRAFFEWAKEFDREYQILWRTRWVQCAIRILK